MPRPDRGIQYPPRSVLCIRRKARAPTPPRRILDCPVKLDNDARGRRRRPCPPDAGTRIARTDSPASCFMPRHIPIIGPRPNAPQALQLQVEAMRSSPHRGGIQVHGSPNQKLSKCDKALEVRPATTKASGPRTRFGGGDCLVGIVPSVPICGREGPGRLRKDRRRKTRSSGAGSRSSAGLFRQALPEMCKTVPDATRAVLRGVRLCAAGWRSCRSDLRDIA